MALVTNALVVDIPSRHPEPLDLTMEPGQIWGVLGPNGVGKTTLLHTLAGLISPRSGVVSWAQKPLPEWHRLALAQQIGVMFQEHQDGFPATVLETALLGRFPYLSPWEMESDKDMQMAKAALEYLDLEGLASRSISQLSGGERQRTALAALLSQDPEMWLVDEPTNHLDLHHQVAVMRLLQRKAQADKLVVMSLHDVNLAATWCSHVLLLYPDGPARMGAAEELLTLEHLQPLYQQVLVQGELDGRLAFLPKVI